MHSARRRNCSSANQLPKRVTINLFFQHNHRDTFCTVAPYRSAPCFLCSAVTRLEYPFIAKKRRHRKSLFIRRPPDWESRSGTAAADQKLVSLHLRFSVLRMTYVGRKESIYLLNFEREGDPFFASFVFKMIKVFA